jgi:hypothetical protein
VVAPELPSQEGRAPSRGICGSAGAHLSKGVRSGATGHVAAPELTSSRRRCPGSWSCDGAGAHLSKEVRSCVVGHVTALEPTSDLKSYQHCRWHVDPVGYNPHVSGNCDRLLNHAS